MTRSRGMVLRFEIRALVGTTGGSWGKLGFVRTEAGKSKDANRPERGRTVQPEASEAAQPRSVALGKL